MKLILIHGRDQQGRNPKELKASWLNAWELGLRKNNLKIPDKLDIAFPYFGDELDKLIRKKDLTTPRKKSFGNSTSIDPERNFYNNLIKEIASNAGLTDENDTKGPLKRHILNAGPSRLLLKKLDELGLGESLLQWRTKDAYMYLTQKMITQKINEMISKEINEELCVIVAHSLGSAIGYNLLHNLPQIHVKEFITLGSPLGITLFKKYVTNPISMPSSLKGNWHNFYDERDYVALRPLDKVHFPLTPDILNYNHIHNHTSNRHGIEGYLDDMIVAKKIYEALMIGNIAN